MNEIPPPRTPARTAALVAGVFGFAAVIVSQSISEGGTNSWSSLTAWAVFGAVAALVTLAPWIPTPAAGRRAAAWRLAAGGVLALAGLWVLFVLPSIHRNIAFLHTLGVVASGWSVWNAPGRPPKAP